MKDRAELGKFQASIGSTNATSSAYLVDDDNCTLAMEPSTDDDSSVGSEQLLDQLYDESLKGEIDLDDIMLSAAHTGKRKGIDAEHLSKTWRIDVDTAQRTLDITTQSSTRRDNPTLSRNYGTNN